MWELSWLLQKGKVPAWNTFLDDFSKVASIWVVFVPDLFRQCGKGFKSAALAVFKELPRQLLGFLERDTVAPDEWNVRRELLLQQLFGMTQKEFFEHVENMSSIVAKDGTKITFFETFTNLARSLSDRMQNLERIWQLAKVSRRKKLMEDLRGQYQDDRELRQAVVDEEARMLQEKLLQFVHETFVAANAAPLCDLVLAKATIRQHMEGYNALREKAVEAFTRDLAEKNPIRSRVSTWVSRQQSAFLAQWTEDNPIDVVINRWKFTGQQQVLLEANLSLPVKDVIESRTIKVARRTFEHSFRIWRPSRWIITRHEYSSNINGENVWHYSVSKHKTVQISSSTPFWRFQNMFVRMGAFFNNGLFFFAANSIFGPFGIRSLFGLEEFRPDRTVDQNTGEIVPTGPSFATWFGRIRSLWRHISASREQFEAIPDRGLIGKGLQRVFNVAWNYGIKGVIGTVGAFVGHLGMVAVNTAVSVVALATSPLWSIASPILIYLFSMLIYDVDACSMHPVFPLFQLVIWRFLIKGVLRAIFSPLLAVGGMAFSSLIALGSVLRWLGRKTWDSLLFYLILKHRSRVPNGDTFLARRTAGPGLSMKYVQRIPTSLALLMIEYQLEMLRVQTFRRGVETEINAPLRRLEAYFAPYRAVGLVSDSSHNKIRSFNETRNKLINRLNKAIENHMKNLIVSGPIHNETLRLTDEDLAEALEMGADIIEKAFKSETIQLDPMFWSNKDLVVDDYHGLASWLLRDSFTERILVPLEENDRNGFRTEVDHLSFQKFFTTIRDARPRDDLEKVQVHHARYNDALFPPTKVVIINPCQLNQNYEQERFIVLTKQ